MIKCSFSLANCLVFVGSNRQTEQLDTADIRSGEKCTILRVKPEPRDAAFFTIVREGVDGSFLRHGVVWLILLCSGSIIRVAIVVVLNWLRRL